MRILHRWAPPFSSVVGVIEHVPAPAAQPTCSAVYHCWIRVPDGPSLTQSMYQLEPLTAFQVYVGVVSLIVPLGETSVAAGGGGPARRWIPLPARSTT